MIFNGRQFAPNFGLPQPGLRPKLPILLPMSAPIDPMRGGGGYVQIRDPRMMRPNGGYRELPRYGVGRCQVQAIPRARVADGYLRQPCRNRPTRRGAIARYRRRFLTHCASAGEVRNAKDGGVPMHPAHLRARWLEVSGGRAGCRWRARRYQPTDDGDVARLGKVYA